MLTNDYKILENTVEIYVERKNKTIHTVIIDLDDLAMLESEGGSISIKDGRRSFYARISKEGTYKYLHRVILNAEHGIVVDHINHNGLDNRKNNLRLLTGAENQQNRYGATKENVSRIRGVSLDSRSNKWRARVYHKGREHLIGYFDDIFEAEKALLKVRPLILPYSDPS